MRPFSLIFMDAASAKGWPREQITELLDQGGMIVLDDFTPCPTWPPLTRGRVDTLRLDWLSRRAVHQRRRDGRRGHLGADRGQEVANSFGFAIASGILCLWPNDAAKPLRILIGIVLMGGFVVLVFVVLSRYAGAWGVPYFSFTTERGSTCTNDFTGYTCTPLTLAEVEFFGRVRSAGRHDGPQGRYRSTHDYQLDAVLDVPRASSAPPR